NEGRKQTPLKIYDNSDEAATTRRGRGRPPGSVNKPKGSTDLKGKGKLATEDTKGKPSKGKKRKIAADSSSFGVSYIPDPPEIRLSPTDDRHNQNNNNSVETLDLISQMRANPTLTNLLFQRGAINPKVIQTLTTLLSEPPNTNSNWNTPPPTITAQGTPQNNTEVLSLQTISNNQSDRATRNHIDLHGFYTTNSPNGGFETRSSPSTVIDTSAIMGFSEIKETTMTNLGVQSSNTHAEDFLLAPPTSDLHTQLRNYHYIYIAAAGYDL
ncbi:hypothetical protein FRX31_033757, partial [Thalictrum thalictroides]